MRTCLSSAALPDASLSELVAACRRRALSGVVLRLGDAHGVHTGSSDGELETVRLMAAEAAVPIVALQRNDGSAPEHGLARLAAALDVPAVIPTQSLDAAAQHTHTLFARAGGRVLFELGADALDVVQRGAVSAELQIAWRIDPAHPAFRATATLLPRLLGARLRQVTLPGGGPELVRSDGLGIGSLMSALALNRFAGAIVLEPASSAARMAWRVWLGRSRGWGCGSQSGAVTPLTVMAAAATARIDQVGITTGDEK